MSTSVFPVGIVGKLKNTEDHTYSPTIHACFYIFSGEVRNNLKFNLPQLF